MRRGGVPLWGTVIGKLLWKNNKNTVILSYKNKNIFLYELCIKKGMS